MTYYWMNEDEKKILEDLAKAKTSKIFDGFSVLKNIMDRGFEDESSSSSTYCPYCEDETCEELESEWDGQSYLVGCTQCGKKYQWDRIITMEEVY